MYLQVNGTDPRIRIRTKMSRIHNTAVYHRQYRLTRIDSDEMFSPAAAGKPRVSPSLATAVSSRHLACQGARTMRK
jgi:hypothetical protein